MKGYVYITGTGTDPSLLGNLNDPLFTRVPTLGACMPNVRRVVTKGDWIFVISGKVADAEQYVVGGLQVEEKIDALAAYNRFPENRLTMSDGGLVMGNVIVQADGTQHPLDSHPADSFQERVKNYVVGGNSIALSTPQEVELGRQQTLGKLGDILGRRRGANRVIDAMGRWSKLKESQVAQMLDWLSGIKAVT
jgi:Nucleotide modification associated domain 2